MNDKIDKSDWKYVPVDADPDFSAEHNQRVIDRTIRKSETHRRKNQKEFDEKTRERASALAQYLKDLDTGKTSSTAKEYFGKKYLAQLRGEEVINKLKKAYAKKE
jgi:hypothetical protein